MGNLLVCFLLLGNCAAQAQEDPNLDAKINKVIERYYLEEQARLTADELIDFSDSGVGCVDDCLEPLEGN